jgi:2-aminophenol/2-amino-5-chlorophenol 1,6-dioxygenase beta subunit
MQEQAKTLGEATRQAIEASGKRALLLASNSLSHRHFTTESDVPEDMSKEHIYNHHQYLWDMKMIEMMRQGRSREIVDMMPEFIAQAVSEADAGGLTWLMSALNYPNTPAEIYAYGTVIGTGNVVAAWQQTEGRA